MSETRRFTKTTPGALGGGVKVEHFEEFDLVRKSDLREGDIVRGVWSAKGPVPGQGSMPFAEANAGYLVDPITVTRSVSPVPEERGVFGTMSPFGSPHRINAMTVERDGQLLLIACNGIEYRTDEVRDFQPLPDPDRAEGRIW